MVMILIMLVFPFLAFSGEFQAHVNRNPTPKGEGVVLSLTLKDGNPSEAPALEPLKNSFAIVFSFFSGNRLQIIGCRYRGLR